MMHFKKTNHAHVFNPKVGIISAAVLVKPGCEQLTQSQEVIHIHCHPCFVWHPACFFTQLKTDPIFLHCSSFFVFFLSEHTCTFVDNLAPFVTKQRSDSVLYGVWNLTKQSETNKGWFTRFGISIISMAVYAR